jgi:hypothetical protein
MGRATLKRNSTITGDRKTNKSKRTRTRTLQQANRMRLPQACKARARLKRRPRK